MCSHQLLLADLHVVFPRLVAIVRRLKVICVFVVGFYCCCCSADYYRLRLLLPLTHNKPLFIIVVFAVAGIVLLLRILWFVALLSWTSLPPSLCHSWSECLHKHTYLNTYSWLLKVLIFVVIVVWYHSYSTYCEYSACFYCCYGVGNDFVLLWTLQCFFFSFLSFSLSRLLIKIN